MKLDTPGKKAVVAAYAAATVVSAVCAWRDLNGRADEEIRGSRRGWRIAMLLNTGNSLPYWLFGRRRAGISTKG